MGEAVKDKSVVSAFCPMCGKMTFDKRYYEIGGNAASHPVVCKRCKNKQQGNDRS